MNYMVCAVPRWVEAALRREEAPMEIAAKAESDLRELVGIPDNYKVLFLHVTASSMMASRRQLGEGDGQR